MKAIAKAFHDRQTDTVFRGIFISLQVETETGSWLPDFVKDEFEAFLECGILAHGFLRLRCVDCAHEKLIAFSCKRRGFCPSCGGRRMAQTAAHLVDHVISKFCFLQAKAFSTESVGMPLFASL